MCTTPDRLARTLNLFESENHDQDIQEIQKQFRNRLRTYIEGQKWVHKPLVLSPAACARYGWKCISGQLLECETCSAKLIPGQLKIESFQTYKACVQEVQENLKTSHKELCPWPLTPCPESFIQIMPVHKDIALKEFRNRFESLVTLGKHLPAIKEGISEKLGLSEDSLNSFFKLLNTEKSEVNLSAFFLAATGWRNETEKPKCLTCFQCQRTVALLLYTSVDSQSSHEQKPEADIKDEVEESTVSESKDQCSASETEDPKVSENGGCDELGMKRKASENDDLTGSDSTKKTKRIKLSEKPLSCFDPLFEHRLWCPWVVETVAREKRLSNSNLDNSTTENGFITLPGWQLFVKCLLRNVGLSEVNASPLKEQIKSARDLLETWNSPT